MADLLSAADARIYQTSTLGAQRLSGGGEGGFGRSPETC
jgi:hypothetical protein